MIEKSLKRLLAEIEKEYNIEAEVEVRKFLDKYGENYTQEQFLEFLKNKYEIINRANAPE